MNERPEHAVDIGHDHWITWFSWDPDRDLNPQYADVPSVDRYGCSVWHPNPRTGEQCSGAVVFDGEVARRIEKPGRPMWQVPSLDPLTISPSVLCCFPAKDGQECGDHGFIREGRWVPA